MVQALTFDEFRKRTNEKYGDEQRIVALVIARYSVKSIKELIDEGYDYWHGYSRDGVDFFWAGYGKYLTESDNNRRILDFPENLDRVFYDQKAYISFKEYLEDKKIYTDDCITILFYEYNNSNLQDQKYFKIKFKQQVEEGRFREIFDRLIRISKGNYSLENVRKEYALMKIKEEISEITISDVITISSMFFGK